MIQKILSIQTNDHLIAIINLNSSFNTEQAGIKKNVSQCYAQTNDSDDENKDDFYNRLQNILKPLKRKDISLLMGDFNARIGRHNTGYEEMTGKQRRRKRLSTQEDPKGVPDITRWCD